MVISKCLVHLFASPVATDSGVEVLRNVVHDPPIHPWSVRCSIGCKSDMLSVCTQRTDGVIALRDLNGLEWFSYNSLLIKCCIGHQTHNFEFDWQSVKGRQQWNTASIWWWLCENTHQSILDMLKFGEVLVCNSRQKWICYNRGF